MPQPVIRYPIRTKNSPKRRNLPGRRPASPGRRCAATGSRRAACSPGPRPGSSRLIDALRNCAARASVRTRGPGSRRGTATGGRAERAVRSPETAAAPPPPPPPRGGGGGGGGGRQGAQQRNLGCSSIRNRSPAPGKAYRYERPAWDLGPIPDTGSLYIVQAAVSDSRRWTVLDPFRLPALMPDARRAWHPARLTDRRTIGRRSA